MKKFSFRLEKVLKLRDSQREISKIELSKKASEYLSEVNRLNELKRSKLDVVSEISKRDTSFEYRQLAESYIVSNEKLQKLQLEDVKKKERPYTEALKDYIEKDVNVKVLEKYKEKLFNEYNREVLKEEQKVVDDIIGGKRYDTHQG